MKITIYYQNDIFNSWVGFIKNPNGSLTIKDAKNIHLCKDAKTYNNQNLGYIEIKGPLKKGVWFPIKHENGSASSLSSSTYVLWD